MSTCVRHTSHKKTRSQITCVVLLLHENIFLIRKISMNFDLHCNFPCKFIQIYGHKNGTTAK